MSIDTAITVCAWLAAAASVGLVLTALPRPSERPRRYKPRHRRPWWPWWPRKTAAIVHVGVTLDSPPLADILPALAGPTIEVATIAEVEADAAVIVEHQHRTEEADEERILAEVRAEIDAAFAAIGYDDEVIRVRMVCGRTEAALLRSAGVTPRRATWDEETTKWRSWDLRELIGARG